MQSVFGLHTELHATKATNGVPLTLPGKKFPRATQKCFGRLKTHKHNTQQGLCESTTHSGCGSVAPCAYHLQRESTTFCIASNRHRMCRGVFADPSIYRDLCRSSDFSANHEIVKCISKKRMWPLLIYYQTQCTCPNNKVPPHKASLQTHFCVRKSVLIPGCTQEHSSQC